MRSAKVAVSIMGAENKQQLTLNALQRAAGFLQAKIAERIDTRYTPKLTFVMDKGVKHSLEVLRILNEVLPPDAKSTAGIADDGTLDDSVVGKTEDDLEDGEDDVAAELDSDDDESDDSDGNPVHEPAKPR